MDWVVKGAEKEKIRMVKATKKGGEPLGKISEYTGLSQEEIRN